ncbi:MAG: hypothetical protein KDK34_19775, partial [Leptospiraceae bacterium]|nr:hypothetical protein [Leptospiraceae bacterium]
GLLFRLSGSGFNRFQERVGYHCLFPMIGLGPDLYRPTEHLSIIFRCSHQVILPVFSRAKTPAGFTDNDTGDVNLLASECTPGFNTDRLSSGVLWETPRGYVREFTITLISRPGALLAWWIIWIV